MTTQQTARQYILELIEWESVNGYSTADLVMECFNCRQVTIDPAGDIYISDPQAGHWLDDAKLEEFVEWHKSQIS